MSTKLAWWRSLMENKDCVLWSTSSVSSIGEVGLPNGRRLVTAQPREQYRQRQQEPERAYAAPLGRTPAHLLRPTLFICESARVNPRESTRALPGRVVSGTSSLPAHAPVVAQLITQTIGELAGLLSGEPALTSGDTCGACAYQLQHRAFFACPQTATTARTSVAVRDKDLPQISLPQCRGPLRGATHPSEDTSPSTGFDRGLCIVPSLRLANLDTSRHRNNPSRDTHRRAAAHGVAVRVAVQSVLDCGPHGVMG